MVYKNVPFRMIGGGILSICCAKDDESSSYFLRATFITVSVHVGDLWDHGPLWTDLVRIRRPVKL